MKKKKVSSLPRFDAADYLKDAESIAEFLTASIEDAAGDESQLLHALNTVARAQKRNMSELARETGITRSGLYEVLAGRRNPTFVTVLRLLGAMGMTVTVTTTE